MSPSTRIRTRAIGALAEEPVLEEQYLPERWSSQYDAPELPVLLNFEMGVVKGTPTCFAVTAMPRDQNAGIQAEDLRLPLKRILEEVIAAAASPRGPLGGVSFADPSSPFAPLEAQLELARRRRSRITDEYLSKVAEIYREAFDRGDPPTVAVQAAFALSRSTAGRHVGLARKRGYLSPTREGVAGEEHRADELPAEPEDGPLGERAPTQQGRSVDATRRSMNVRVPREAKTVRVPRETKTVRVPRETKTVRVSRKKGQKR
jgi:hypothetical protein